MTGDLVTLRHARLADIPLLRRWESEPHIVEISGDDGGWDWETEIAQDVSWREMLIAELGGSPIGFIQIIDPHEEETHYWGDCESGLRAIDIWIGEADCLGRGYGTQMMRQALDRCFSVPDVQAVLIDPLASNERAIRFYRKIGFQFVERRTFGDDDCFVMRLERTSFECERSSSH
jgi:aminoglycoside 6'-N-acetyltransferase